MYQLNKIQSILEVVYEKEIKYRNYKLQEQIGYIKQKCGIESNESEQCKAKKKRNMINLKSCKTNDGTNSTSALRGT